MRLAHDIAADAESKFVGELATKPHPRADWSGPDRKTVIKTVVISSPRTISTSGTGLFAIHNRWWAAVDSNHLPPRYQHGALPVELAAHGLGKGSCPGQNGRTGTLPWHESALEGGAERVSGADIRPRPNPRGLHRRSDFVDGDLASRLE